MLPDAEQVAIRYAKQIPRSGQCLNVSERVSERSTMVEVGGCGT